MLTQNIGHKNIGLFFYTKHRTFFTQNIGRKTFNNNSRMTFHNILNTNLIDELLQFTTVALEVASKHCILVGFAHYTSAGFVVTHRPLTRVSGLNK